MKISGFTIVRNAIQYGYPAVESIQSILPICDEFIVNVGDSEDDTLALIQSIRDPKIRIINNTWDLSLGKEMLSHQTNLAFKECRGDWAFYLQADEVIHENDLERLLRCMKDSLKDEAIEALRLKWFHFYGSCYRYRVDYGWFQKQERIIKNNGTIESWGDAWAFRRKDGQPLKIKNTGCFVYHYGWVHSPAMMTWRRVNAERIGFTALKDWERREEYSYGDLERFPVYWGTHPRLMQDRVRGHPLSEEDRRIIQRKYWWHPARIFRVRYKTFKRRKTRINP